MKKVFGIVFVLAALVLGSSASDARSQQAQLRDSRYNDLAQIIFHENVNPLVIEIRKYLNFPEMRNGILVLGSINGPEMWAKLGRLTSWKREESFTVSSQITRSGKLQFLRQLYLVDGATGQVVAVAHRPY